MLDTERHRYGHPDDDLRQVGAVVFAVAKHAEAVLALGKGSRSRSRWCRTRQIDLEVQRVGDREEHFALDLLIALEQEVHRPIKDLRV
jgi:hypothetical protein